MDQSRYAELFRAEAREHLAELDATLLACERDGDAAHVATLFRSTHTIKGMAAAMRYGVVERIAHALETLLEVARHPHGDGAPRTLPPAALSAETVALLFEGTDALRSAVEHAVAGHADLEPIALASLLQRVASHAALAREHPVSAIAPPATEGLFTPARFAAESSDSTDEHQSIQVRLTADCPLKGVRAMLVMARLTPLGAVLDVVPAQDRWLADAFDGVFTVTLRTSATVDVLEAAVRAAGDVARVVVAERRQAARPAPTNELMETVRVDRRRLDTLLELVGELVINRDRLSRLAEDSDLSPTRALTRAAYDSARLISALQHEVLQTRMVPIGQVFDRFPRLVRDLAHTLGKDVAFVTEGRELELDRALVDAISDPLLHLLRNALDHGIEDGPTRRLAGKPAAGRLVLRAARDRAAVILQVEDDGRGIDREAVRQRAQRQGVLPDTVTALDDDALLQLLAHPGFSTAQAVTSISGRGVGVDVVATRVRALGGTLSMETLEGQGTVFTLRLPVTLAIARALLVQVAGETYALPAAHMVEALEYDPAMIVAASSGERLVLREEQLPVIHVRERFGRPRQTTDSHFVVVEVGGRRAALLVDTLIAQQDIVVKPLVAVRGSAPWFTGATVLGDGTPSLIVDLGSLT